MPCLTPLVEKVSCALNGFTLLPVPGQNTTLAVVAIAAALGPVILGLGGIVSGIGAALPVLAALAAVIPGTAIPALVAFVVAMSPILLPAAAVAAAIVGIVLAVRHWDEISAIAKRSEARRGGQEGGRTCRSRCCALRSTKTEKPESTNY